MEFVASELNNDERLYRAVAPLGMYWKQGGGISSAVFKDPNGVSTDRDMGREVSECITHLLGHLEIGGSVVSVTVKQCSENEALVKYDPKEDNTFHTLILNGIDSIKLTDGKAKRLAKIVRYDYFDDFGANAVRHPEANENPPSLNV